MITDEKTKQERLETCKQCEFKRDDFKLFNIILFKRELQCSICKCFLEAKTSIEFAKCPKDKWVK